MKTRLKILWIIMFLTAPILAQSGAVPITGGRILINGETLGGTGEIQTSVFSASSQFAGSTNSYWETDCFSVGCAGGTTFDVPKLWAFANTYRGVSFTVGSVTYDDVYQHADGLTLGRLTFTVPKISRRKGLIRLRKTFNLGGRFRVCRLDDTSQTCPPEQVLFDKNIEGRGTLIVTGRIKLNPLGRPRWYIETFEYIFEP